jgi:hypothetical protein
MNKEVSDLASINPREVMYVVNRLYQARGACFNPYRDLLRRQTQSSCTGSTNRLAVVDGLQEGAVQECILHIEFMNRPGAGDNQGEDSVDRGWLDHQAEGLIVVDAGSRRSVRSTRP